MQIFVRTLDERTLTLHVQPEDTINEIKEIVEQREGPPFADDDGSRSLLVRLSFQAFPSMTNV